MRPFSVFTRTLRAFGSDHGALLAGAIAYYVMFSFIPLISLIVAGFGLVTRDPAVQRQVVDRVLQMMPLDSGPGQNLILDTIRSISTQAGTLTVMGVVGLLWSSAGVFGAIREALDVAWDAPSRHGFIRQKLRDFAAVLGLALLFAVSFAGTIGQHFLHTLVMQWTGGVGAPVLESMLTVAGLLIPAVFSFVAFLLVYRFVPNVRHGVGDVWAGALVAAVLFEVIKHGFAYYVSHFQRYQAVYGALSAVMLFMLWAYLAAVILLIGAEFAAEQERARRGLPSHTEGEPQPLQRPSRAAGS